MVKMLHNEQITILISYLVTLFALLIKAIYTITNSKYKTFIIYMIFYFLILHKCVKK